jgi:hypothetical protein
LSAAGTVNTTHIERKGTFNGRCTERVEWLVFFNNALMIACDKKKDAEAWAQIYSN